MDFFIDVINNSFSWIPNDNFIVALIFILLGWTLSVLVNQISGLFLRVIVYWVLFLLMLVILLLDKFNYYTFYDIPYFLYFGFAYFCVDIYHTIKYLFVHNKPKKQSYWHNEKSVVDWLVYVLVLFALCTLLILFWPIPFPFTDLQARYDLNILASFGDYVGGVLGTLLGLVSISLMFVTFYNQRKVTIQNREQIELQRFNDLFFRLLDNFKEERKIVNQKFNQKKFPGLNREIDFFETGKTFLQSIYRAKFNSTNQILNDVFQLYSVFYQSNSDLSHYFRNLYSIYEMVDNSIEVDDKYKREYFKVVRAELTDSELFVLKYNSLLPEGSKFRYYFYKYNILKYLPKMETLEYRQYSIFLSESEKMSLNTMLTNMHNHINDVFKSNVKHKQVSSLESFGDYQAITLEMPNNYTLIIKTIFDKKKILKLPYVLTSALDKLQPSLFSLLLDTFLNDIFSNPITNKLDENISINKETTCITSNLVICQNSVVNKKNKRLFLNQVI